MNISLAKMVTGLGLLNALALLLLAGAFYLYNSSQSDVTQTYENKYRSYLLADELRQSSDDLTRLARTYVVSGDAKYEIQYFDILDIRNGKKPRPADYHRIYWDFIAADLPKPRPDTETVALSDLMAGAGFSKREFTFLAKAQANSDGLVGLEVKAMNAVKGLFDDGAGNYTVKKDPDFKIARDLLHSVEYHKYKADIMAPVDSFFASLEVRTNAAVMAAEDRLRFFGTLATVALIIVVVSIAVTFWLIISRVIQSLHGMKDAMTELSNENMDYEIPKADRDDEIGEMANAVQIFKDGMLERRALREEAQIAVKEQTDREERDRIQKEEQDAEQRRKEHDEVEAREKRAKRISDMVTQFKNKTSNLLSTLSGSASVLQNTANSLVATADGSRELSATVAAASHEASNNVQTSSTNAPASKKSTNRPFTSCSIASTTGAVPLATIAPSTAIVSNNDQLNTNGYVR